AALDAPVVALLERKRPGLILHSIDPRAGIGRFDPLPGASLASVSRWLWCAFYRRGRKPCVFSSGSRLSVFGVGFRDREHPYILYDIQRVRRADELGRKSPSAPRESGHR